MNTDKIYAEQLETNMHPRTPPRWSLFASWIQKPSFPQPFLPTHSVLSLRWWLVLGMDKSYDRMFRHVFTPILDRYGVLQQDRPYIMAFYIRGLMAIISEWLKNDCADSITYVTGVIQQCVKMPQSETMNAV